MKEGYRLLGDFIRQVDVRNTDGKEENLFGVSVQKIRQRGYLMAMQKAVKDVASLKEAVFAVQAFFRR